MTQQFSVPLWDVSNKQFVSATLINNVDVEFAVNADNSWLSYIDSNKENFAKLGTPHDEFEHSHWRWETKVTQTINLLSYPTMGIKHGNDIQGLMMLSTDGHFSKILSQLGLPIVYIPFLASAPWNQAKLITEPKFKGVGTTFLRAAIETSLDLEFSGRIGLHSLPQSEEWYEKHGMTCLGLDEDKQMKYYEMDAKQAATFLGEIK